MAGKRISIMVVVAGLAVGLTTPVLAAADPDGRYQGRMKGSDAKVRLKVANDGGRVNRFRTVVVAVCINPNVIGGIEVVPVPVSVDSTRIKASGRFSTRKTVRYRPTGARYTTRVSGALKGKRIRRGKVRLERTCEARDSYSARRRAG